MCGIAGFCRFNEDYRERDGYWRQVLISMRSAIAHRGHDQTGEYVTEKVGFSHTRLSIRDLSGGRQPMISHHQGAEYAIVYNGEIYNTEELRQELILLGFAFETTCDTEVVLKAYLAYGEPFIDRLNGIFSFAIWDGKREILRLYRDRLGVKPLFYTITGGSLVFGSEIKSLFAHPSVTPRIDLDGLREVLGVGPARTPGNGVFEGILEVKPGCCLTFSSDGITESPYWQLRAEPHEESYEETVSHVRFLLQDAVNRQLVSDVPVCSFLSGGIDSTIITALAANILAEKGSLLNTFSFDFAGNDDSFTATAFQPSRDRPYVEEAISLFPVRHTFLTMEESLLPSLLLRSVESKDLPGMADVDSSLQYFCRLVKEHNKVALTGECADELFGGYPWFYKKELFYTDGFPWSRDTFMRTLLLTDDMVQKLDLTGYSAMCYQNALKEVPCLPEEDSEARRVREVSYLSIRWFMQTLLDRMDRASMACSLEARVPFADHRLVEYLYNVPWSMKYRNQTEKALLRDAFSHLLPQSLLYRKKSPYPKTYDRTYESLLSHQLSTLMTDQNAPIRRLLDPKKVEQFLRMPKDYGKPWFGQLMAGPQLIAYMIQVNHWMTIYGLE